MSLPEQKTDQLKKQINTAFNNLHSQEALQSVAKKVEKVIAELNTGGLRVAEKTNNQWVTHEWIKQAILIYFRLRKMQFMHGGDMVFYDKVPLKKWKATDGVRAVPNAIARFGSYIAPHVVLMPSFVNIGAYVDSGTMVDTWATVGSCAQVGKQVHLSGGVGIGGVLEPIQSRPVIIEDNVFIGSRSIIVEGAIVRKRAVIGAGVTITASTRIIDTTQSKEIIYRGEVPENAVVIPGHTSKKLASGTYSIPCAIIIGHRSKKTDLKTSLNDSLRFLN